MTLALLACYHSAAQPKSQKVISCSGCLPEDPCCSRCSTVWARLCLAVAAVAASLARLHVWSMDVVWRQAGVHQKAPFLLQRWDRSQSVPKSRCGRPLFSFALGLPFSALYLTPSHSHYVKIRSEKSKTIATLQFHLGAVNIWSCFNKWVPARFYLPGEAENGSISHCTLKLIE